MTWEEATGALLQHFNARWAALHPTIPVHFPNMKAVTPDATTRAWLRLHFLPAFSRRVAVGGQLREQAGEAVVNVFTPLDAGDGAAVDFDREIESIWETAHVNGLDGGVHLGAPDPLPGIQDPDAPWWRSGVSIAFRFDHTP